MTRLSVNLNKFALLRNSRGRNRPDVEALARRCIAAGAHGITLHPRPDQRHARDADVRDLGALVVAYPEVELNVEGNPSERFMELVLETRPAQCTLVPDSPEQVTSDHGWDVVGAGARLAGVVAKLRDAGIRVSLFLEPEPEQVRASAGVGAERIELYTEPYARAFGTGSQSVVLSRFEAAARLAGGLGLGVNAGHDLDLDNLGAFLAAVPGVLEVSIGHALVCDCLDFGLEPTLARYLAIVRERSPAV